MAMVAAPGFASGCSHYKRLCKLIAPCCNNVYTCRLCHDERENHKMDRQKVSRIVCATCPHVQPVGKRCKVCQTKFGRYACLTCKLFDNEDKGQFHCQECGICRVGGSLNYFHCKVCNLCLAIRLYNHVCVENASRMDCPICVEDLHSSRVAPHVPPCGHLIHETCYQILKQSGDNNCPICKKAYTN